MVFTYRTGEEALSAAKKSVREKRGTSMCRQPMPDGTDCFEVRDKEDCVLEKHTVLNLLGKVK